MLSKSTGRATYNIRGTDLTAQDVTWFPSLYALLRKIEVGAEAGQLCCKKSSGEPWELDENGGELALITESDLEDDSDEEDEDGHDTDEGEAEMAGAQLANLNVNG